MWAFCPTLPQLNHNIELIDWEYFNFKGIYSIADHVLRGEQSIDWVHQADVVIWTDFEWKLIT